MSHRVNIVLEDAAWDILLKLPRGKRSQMVNQAIVEAGKKQQRLAAAEKMDQLRKASQNLPAGTIVSWIREDRGR